MNNFGSLLFGSQETQLQGINLEKSFAGKIYHLHRQSNEEVTEALVSEKKWHSKKGSKGESSGGNGRGQD